jgi:hypothetical protein
MMGAGSQGLKSKLTELFRKEKRVLSKSEQISVIDTATKLKNVTYYQALTS